MELDWSSVQPQGDEIRIALSTTPDPVRRETFEQVAAQSERETRGQTWSGVQLEVDGRGVVVFGIEPDTQSQDVRVYLTDLIGAVDREAGLTRQREARQTAQDEHDEQSQTEAMKRIADELRGAGLRLAVAAVLAATKVSECRQTARQVSDNLVDLQAKRRIAR